MHEVGSIMGESRVQHFNGVPLRRLGEGSSIGAWTIDSRDLTKLAHRIHQHVLNAARSALAEGEGVFRHIFEGKYRTKHQKVYPRFLLTLDGVRFTFRHMRNRLGLDKDGVMDMLIIAFDRAEHGLADPEPAEPAPDEEIRPPDEEPLLALMFEADPRPEAMVDPKLSRKINGAVKFLLRYEVGLPEHLADGIDTWNQERLDAVLAADEEFV